MEPISLPKETAGDRIRLKKYEQALAPALFAAAEADRERIGAFMPWVKRAETLEDTKAYISFLDEKWNEKSWFEYAILDGYKDQLLGGICVPRIDWANDRCEIGYWNRGAVEGLGFVTEAVLLLEQILFSVGFNRIEVACSVDNPRSENIPKKCGYTFEGLLRQWFTVNETYQDMNLYSKVKADLN